MLFFFKYIWPSCLPWDWRIFLLVFALSALYRLFMDLFVFRNKLIDGNSLFCVFLKTPVFASQHVLVSAALSITMFSLQAVYCNHCKDIHSSASSKRHQLALPLLSINREEFRVCANRFEWHPASALFVYSVLLSLPGQPPCLYLGLCRDTVASTATGLLLRGTQPPNVLTPVKRKGV